MGEMINIVNKALTVYFADHISIAENDISFQKPKKEWINSTGAATTVPKMSVYLFDIRENVELRNNEWQAENYDKSIKRKKPDVRIDLFYIITFYSQGSNVDESIEEEHKWLSETLSVVYNNANIPEEYFYDETGEIISGIPKIPAIPIQEKFFGEDGVLQLWSALDQYLMPAIYLKVTIPVSLAKYIEDAKVFTKILKFGIPDQKSYYTLNINPPVVSLVCNDSNDCVMSRIGMQKTLNYLDTEVSVNTNEITLIDRNNINPHDFIVIKDGIHSELCEVSASVGSTDNNKITLTLKTGLKYSHPKGCEIKKAEVGNPEELQQINFVEDIQSGSSQFKVIGGDVEKLKNGDLLSLKKNNSNDTEYFFITAKFKENIEIKEIFEVDGLNT